MDDLYRYITVSDTVDVDNVRKLLSSCNIDVISTIFQKYLHRDDIKLDIVEEFVNNGVKLNGKDFDDKNIPLCTLLSNKFIDYNNAIDITSFMITHGADINKRNKDGRTPIFCLLHNSTLNNLEFVSFMIDHGADITIVDGFGFTSLQIYLQSSNVQLDLVELLIQKGVDVNIHNNWFYYNTLHCYIKKNYNRINMDIIKYIMDNGFIINENKFTKSTFLDILVSIIDSKNFDSNVVDFILKYIDINEKNIFDFTPLYCSVDANNEKMCSYLLKKNADPNIITVFGETCILTAINNHNKNILYKLLNYDIDINTIQNTLFKLEQDIINSTIDSYYYNNLVKKEHFIKLFLAYIVKRYEKNMGILFLDYPTLGEYFVKFIDTCMMEIFEMKSDKVGNTDIYSIIFTNKYIPIKYITCKKLKKYESFVVYGNEIKSIIKSSKIRYASVIKVTEYITSICSEETSLWNSIPIEIKHKIINNINNHDMYILYKNRKKK
nr:ankyrin repeat protein [Swinepox virus]